MAKAKRKEMHIPQGAVQQDAATVAPGGVSQAPASVVPAAQGGAQVIQHPAILVYDGGKNAVNIAGTPLVHPADLEQAGTALKRLAFNVMIGTVDPALMNRDAAFWANRAIKDHKTAFFGLMEVKGENGKGAAQIIRERWNAECEAKKNDARARIAQITLSGLWKLFRKPRAGGGESPYSRIKGKYLEFVKNVRAKCEARGVNKDRKLAMILETCAEAETALEGGDEEK